VRHLLLVMVVRLRELKRNKHKMNFQLPLESNTANFSRFSGLKMTAIIDFGSYF
jgi:hypothetical protein